ncbi:translation initiation factor IF-2 N-terminal domain-containing protein [bacterium]|nr:translation initiation factor IF-2 N-terminal domain-containing protein [bacterium]
MTRHDSSAAEPALAPAKDSGGKAAKVRIYQIAKDFSISSDAMLKIVHGLGVEAKSHMSSIDMETVEKVKQTFAKEKEAVKEDIARKAAVHRRAVAAADGARWTRRSCAPTSSA